MIATIAGTQGALIAPGSEILPSDNIEAMLETRETPVAWYVDIVTPPAYNTSSASRASSVMLPTTVTATTT